MLSRIAESLYWIGRYVERAEDTARLLDVHYHLLLEDRRADEASVCRALLEAMGADDALIGGEPDAAAATALRPGGILLAYLPTINQTALLRQALDDDSAPFGLPETQEIIRRTWHIEARSVRPDHRMVGHTGFLTTARRLSL